MKIRFKHEKPDELSVWALGLYIWGINKKWWGIDLHIGKHIFSWNAE